MFVGPRGIPTFYTHLPTYFCYLLTPPDTYDPFPRSFDLTQVRNESTPESAP